MLKKKPRWVGRSTGDVLFGVTPPVQPHISIWTASGRSLFGGWTALARFVYKTEPTWMKYEGFLSMYDEFEG